MQRSVLVHFYKGPFSFSIQGGGLVLEVSLRRGKGRDGTPLGGKKLTSLTFSLTPCTSEKLLHFSHGALAATLQALRRFGVVQTYQCNSVAQFHIQAQK